MSLIKDWIRSWSPEERLLTIKWIFASCLGILLVFGLTLLSRSAYPDIDQWALLRKLLANATPAILGIIIIVGILNFFDFCTKTDWTDKIGETDYGATAVYCMLIYVFGRILAGF